MRHLYFKRLSVLLIILFSLLASVQSQDYEPWIAIPNNPSASEEWFPGGLVHSENLGLNIFRGLFEGNQAHYFMAGYDGENWITIADSVSNFIRTIVDYQDGILVGGSTSYIGGQVMPNIAYYNGVNWEYPWEFNDSVYRLISISDTIYALGNFTEIDGESIHKIAKLTPSGWVGLIENEPEMEFSLWRDIAYFMGSYYVGGNFETATGINDLAKIENGFLTQVGIGIQGTFSGVNQLEVYQDYLVIAGRIPFSDGNVGNHIMRWNNETFSQIGPLFNNNFGNPIPDGNIGHMKSNGEYLFIGGAFQDIGDVPMKYLARWDGENWCSMNTDEFDGIYKHFDLAGDSIVFTILEQPSPGVFTPFWSLGNLNQDNFCTEPLSVNDVSKNQESFELFPNPSSNQITIQSEAQIEQVEILDVSGRVVLLENALLKDGQVDISALPSGIYIVRIQTTDGGYGLRKLVVE